MYVELQKLWRKKSKISNVIVKGPDCEIRTVNLSTTWSVIAVIKGDFSNESKYDYEEKPAEFSILLEM
jgi:hypothetical protein